MLTKHIKLLLSTAVISFISLSNIHANAGIDASPFEGLYAGVITTKNTFSTTSSYLEVPVTDIPSVFSGITNSAHKNGFGGGILGGYGINYGILYTGIEAAFMIDKGNTIISDGTNTLKISKSNTLDVNLRVGLTLSNKAMVFGLIGYSGAVLKSKGLNQILIANDREYNKRITSYKFGAGFEIAVMENIAFRLEYTRSKYANASLIYGSDQFIFKPKTSRIMASFILHMY